MKVGLVGLGRMGRAIHARLTENGCEVTAWDRDARAMKAAAEHQVRLADSPRAVAAAGDVGDLDHHRGQRRARACSAARTDSCPAT